MFEGFERRQLDGWHCIWIGRLPEELRLGSAAFDALWQLHPAKFHEVLMGGRRVKTPRWQQAYGVDYRYSGNVNRALAVPALLKPFLKWAWREIDDCLNSMLVNWYEGRLGHYMGRHRDSTGGLLKHKPIVTISLGEERIFRLRPHKGEGRKDFTAGDGTVLIIPYETNLSWTHEVPHTRNRTGRRISVTLRGMEVSEGQSQDFGKSTEPSKRPDLS